MNSAVPTLPSELERLRQHYDELARRHGYGPEATHWSSLATQEQRLRVLAEVIREPDASVLDFGCGTGHLYQVLRKECAFRGRYTGYDLSGEALALARGRHHDAAFEQRDIFQDGVGGQFDYAVISGVFNNRLSDNWAFLTGVLRRLFPRVRRGLVFNALSTYVDYKDATLYYADPEEVFHFCKENLSPAVNLRHDYEIKAGVLPFEFTVEVICSPHAPRPKNAS
jgi:SAM-dependent methyltransferase